MSYKPEPNNEVVINDSGDLPEVSNGRHQLKDNTVYRFSGFITSSNGLELGSATVLKGGYGATDGFIHTGTSTAVYARDVGLFIDDMYIHAPGGTIFDCVDTVDSEVLILDSSFSDAAGLGNIADLGTLDGFRVPTFKSCNFEEFDAGLTLTGSCDKVFFSGCPLRTVTASNVTILTFDASFSTDIIDITDCYVKSVQSDTQVINVDASATISEVFQYRGTTHDATVTKSNILTGAADAQKVGYNVQDSDPVRNSSVIGELSLDSATTTTITTQDTYTTVDGATSLGNESERVTQSSNGVLQYDGRRDVNVHISASLTAEVPNNTEVSLAITKNGTVEPTSEAQITGKGSVPSNVSTSGVEDIQNGDTISLQIKNNTGTEDIPVERYNISFLGG
jgi:hypothetical protein